MGIYAGAKAMDAEIHLNLIEREIQMDYSLNKYGSIFDSNRSVVLDSEFRNSAFGEKLAYVIIDMALTLSAIPVFCLMPVFTILNKHQITGPKVQYRWQQFLKWYFSTLKGITVQTKSGELNDSKLAFFIPSNIWVEYNLEGDYQRNVRSISLVRNIIERKRYGRFVERRQDGWKVLFEFTEPPKQGCCVLFHL